MVAATATATANAMRITYLKKVSGEVCLSFLSHLERFASEQILEARLGFESRR